MFLTKGSQCNRYWKDCSWSDVIDVKSGVTEGGSISPILCNLYIAGLITKVRVNGFDCYVDCDYIGCILFAGDILLLSASIIYLQSMLDICAQYGKEWDLKFNANKCALMPKCGF